MYTKKIVFILFSFVSLTSWAQLRVSEHTINWYSELVSIYPDTQKRIAFEDFGSMEEFKGLPCYIKFLGDFTDERSFAKLYISNEQFRAASAEEATYLRNYDHLISSEFSLQWRMQEYKYKFQLDAFVLPIRKNASTGGYELLTKFNILSNNTKIDDFELTKNSRKNETSIKDASVLASAPFFKLSLRQTGMYKLSFQDMQKAGILDKPVNSANIALFGNPAGMLSLNNADVYYDDLTEIPIAVYDGGDGSFDPNDYILFYGQSPVVWQWNSNRENPVFTHQINHYDDNTYYFLSVDYTDGERKRVQNADEINQSPSKKIRRFIDYQYYEKDLYNACNGGLNWMGEIFRESNASQNFNFNFPGLILDSVIQIRLGVAANKSSSFILSSNGFNEEISIFDMGKCLTPASAKFAYTPINTVSRFQLTYKKSNMIVSDGYLDYFTFQYHRNLMLNEGQVVFRSVEAIETPVEFQIEHPTDVQIWKVDKLWNIESIKTKTENQITSFIRNDDNLAEFVAFDGRSFLNSLSIQKVDTQNLHALNSLDYIIVTHPNFKEEADTLAELHRKDNVKTAVVTTTQVYNEFASGIADPSAIRRLMKMLYDKARINSQQTPPSYLLLFGDASYDVKNILGNNTNFIPTFQTPDYWNVDGIATDDDFAYMGDNEYSTGTGISGIIDIAVGRLPVSTKAQAQAVIRKIQCYTSASIVGGGNNANLSSNFGDWKNTITFVTDDGEKFDEAYEDSGRFSEVIFPKFPEINVEKIYSDAYQRYSTPKGATYPDARKALHDRINQGALFVGYMGHSGWDAWSDEKLLILEDIHKWKNQYAFPMMFSSSCTFSYFDQIDKTSGGELCVLAPDGGGISMIAASRVAYGGSIEGIQSDFITHALEKQNGIAPSIGDAYLHAKINNRGHSIRVFVLFGDPALKVALPRYEIKTTEINGKDINQGIDTLKAFSTVEIAGEINLPDGALYSDFNGVLQVQIFDKMTEEKTRGNQNSKGHMNSQVPYKVQQSTIYKGQTDVVDGKFTFTFIVPKDIAYNYGFGKISYYAYSDSLGDATGYFNQIPVGGFDENAKEDTTPPVVELYIDGASFRDGGTVGNKPTIIANIFDDYGINTTGSGIGHDLLLIIDGNVKNNIVLNELFRYDLGSYTTGSLIYTLPELSPGKHSLELKVWNIHNLSTLTRLNFIVEDPAKFKIFDLYNIPNPAKDHTSFYFTHNSDEKMDRVEIELYGIYGGLMGKFEQKIENTSYVVGPIYWECKTLRGQKLPNGMYFYIIKLYDKKGNMAKLGQKLLIGI